MVRRSRTNLQIKADHFREFQTLSLLDISLTSWITLVSSFVDWFFSDRNATRKRLHVQEICKSYRTSRNHNLHKLASIFISNDFSCIFYCELISESRRRAKIWTNALPQSSPEAHLLKLYQISTNLCIDEQSFGWRNMNKCSKLVFRYFTIYTKWAISLVHSKSFIRRGPQF